MQDIVVGNKNFTDVTKPKEIVQLLLNEDQLANFPTKSTANASPNKKGKQPAGQADSIDVGRNLWDEEGDDFFGCIVGEHVLEDELGEYKLVGGVNLDAQLVGSYGGKRWVHTSQATLPLSSTREPSSMKPRS